MHDRAELKQQVNEALALIDNLRPHPEATLISRNEMRVLAAKSDDVGLIQLAQQADEHTMFWELHGEYVIQKVNLWEEEIT